MSVSVFLTQAFGVVAGAVAVGGCGAWVGAEYTKRKGMELDGLVIIIGNAIVGAAAGAVLGYNVADLALADEHVQRHDPVIIDGEARCLDNQSIVQDNDGNILGCIEP